jgi:hypothetical protein
MNADDYQWTNPTDGAAYLSKIVHEEFYWKLLLLFEAGGEGRPCHCRHRQNN